MVVIALTTLIDFFFFYNMPPSVFTLLSANYGEWMQWCNAPFHLLKVLLSQGKMPWERATLRRQTQLALKKEALTPLSEVQSIKTKRHFTGSIVDRLTWFQRHSVSHWNTEGSSLDWKILFVPHHPQPRLPWAWKKNMFINFEIFFLRHCTGLK